MALDFIENHRQKFFVLHITRSGNKGGAGDASPHRT